MHSFAVAILAAVHATSASPPAAHTQRVFSTIDQSEWCPAGNVQLDLQSGEYLLTSGGTPPSCIDPHIDRPVRTGRLDSSRLSGLRTAFDRAIAEGMVNPECGGGRRPDHVVISNGGAQILVLTTGAATVSARDELTCWSKAAWDLHRVIDEEFRGIGRK